MAAPASDPAAGLILTDRKMLYGRWRERFGPARRLTRPDPLAPGTVEVSVTGPVTLPAGSPLRGAPCLFCRDLAGGRAVRVVLIWGTDQAPCRCGDLHPGGWVMCAHHDITDTDTIIRQAARRMAAAHPRKGTPR